MLFFFPLLPIQQMQFMLLFSRQGKLRLQKWYVPLSDKEKKKITRELVQTVLARKPKMCSFLEWRDLKIVYKRWFCLTNLVIAKHYKRCIKQQENNDGCFCFVAFFFSFPLLVTEKTDFSLESNLITKQESFMCGKSLMH